MKYECPCCKHYTLPKPVRETLAYICPVCFWEDDFLLFRDDESSTSNGGMTLIEGRRNYQTYGACEKELVQYVRKPLRDELGED